MSLPEEAIHYYPYRRANLPVPHYWQLSESFGLNEYDARRVCALVCLKTVLDYKLPSNPESGIPLEDIITRASAHGGRTENGWLHAAEVATLNDYGLNAWRRDWSQSYMQAVFAQRREGYAQAQVDALQAQQLAESPRISPLDKAILSITNSIDEGNPVIASVRPGFSENGGPHQIVIHGYEESPDGLDMLITDPIIQDRAHQEQFVDSRYFSEFFQLRSIFVTDGRQY
jgi:hypothetical protein